jgi:hypothetical protein
MNIKQLRKDVPAWTWRARKEGMAWRYQGDARDGSGRVIIRKYSVLCGPCEDDFATQWRVEDGTTSNPYEIWFIDQAVKS